MKNCTTCNVLVPKLPCCDCNERTGWKNWKPIEDSSEPKDKEE